MGFGQHNLASYNIQFRMYFGIFMPILFIAIKPNVSRVLESLHLQTFSSLDTKMIQYFYKRTYIDKCINLQFSTIYTVVFSRFNDNGVDTACSGYGQPQVQELGPPGPDSPPLLGQGQGGGQGGSPGLQHRARGRQLAGVPPGSVVQVELQTEVHKVRYHGEGHYQGLLLVENGFYRFDI